MRLAALAVLAVSLWCVSCGSNSKDDTNAETIAISVRQWAFTPAQITLKKGVPVILELTSEDVHHGFNVAEWQVRADIVPGNKTQVPVTPTTAGTFSFFCDYYCGSGHEGMQGQITVE
jgi:cytochrome c oxidase subunit 2